MAKQREEITERDNLKAISLCLLFPLCLSALWWLGTSSVNLAARKHSERTNLTSQTSRQEVKAP